MGPCVRLRKAAPKSQQPVGGDAQVLRFWQDASLSCAAAGFRRSSRRLVVPPDRESGRRRVPPGKAREGREGCCGQAQGCAQCKAWRAWVPWKPSLALPHRPLRPLAFRCIGAPSISALRGLPLRCVTAPLRLHIHTGTAAPLHQRTLTCHFGPSPPLLAQAPATPGTPATPQTGACLSLAGLLVVK